MLLFVRLLKSSKKSLLCLPAIALSLAAFPDETEKNPIDKATIEMTIVITPYRRISMELSPAVISYIPISSLKFIPCSLSPRVISWARFLAPLIIMKSMYEISNERKIKPLTICP